MEKEIANFETGTGIYIIHIPPLVREWYYGFY
jgi:hypothetical protein